MQYGAKAGRADTEGKLDLELVPVAAGNFNAFVLQFKGKPLAKTEVTVFGPPKWEKRFHSDENGRIEITTPWPGQYVLEAAHVEDKPGEADGRAYAKIRYVSTTTFNVKSSEFCCRRRHDALPSGRLFQGGGRHPGRLRPGVGGRRLPGDLAAHAVAGRRGHGADAVLRVLRLRRDLGSLPRAMPWRAWAGVLLPAALMGALFLAGRATGAA